MIMGFKLLPEVFWGAGSLKQLADVLRNIKAEYVLVVTDQGIVKAGIADKVISVAKEVCSRTEIFDQIESDPKDTTVVACAAKYKNDRPDAIVAVGGGSCMDFGKAVNVLLYNDGTIQDYKNQWDAIPNLTGTLVTIPTTAGTGSEATSVAVIRNPELNIKMEYISQQLMPDVAILDPKMTKTLPPRITASTGMDTLCHAIEAFSCLQKNPLSDAYAAQAIELVRDYLLKAVCHGYSKEARLAMANASFLAGAAFSNSMVGVVHAIGHALGGVCHVAHGDAMTILLPTGMLFNRKVCKKEDAKLLLYLAGPEIYVKTPEEKRADRAIHEVLALRSRLHRLTGLPVTLKEAGVDPASFPEVAKVALNDGAVIVNPRQVTYDAVIRILEVCYGD